MPLAIRGGVDVEAWELVTRGGVNAGILIGERKDQHHTKNISINAEKGGKRIRVNAPDGSGVNVLRQVESTYLYSVTVHRPSDEPAFRIRSNELETKTSSWRNVDVEGLAIDNPSAPNKTAAYGSSRSRRTRARATPSVRRTAARSAPSAACSGSPTTQSLLDHPPVSP